MHLGPGQLLQATSEPILRVALALESMARSGDGKD
jgi:hypothetical protein